MDMENEHSEFYLKKRGAVDCQIVHNEKFGSAEPLAQAVTEYAPWMRSLMKLSTLRIGGRNFSSFLSPGDPSTTAEPILTPVEAQCLQAEDTAIVR